MPYKIKDLDMEQLQMVGKIAGAIKQLSIEAIEKASSGHPGLPLGCAEIAALLFGFVLRHNPKNPNWLNRDRFVLSAGHGSMLLYSSLFLSGFDLTLDDIQDFRKMHSLTPGHPEFGVTKGVEATTGPLGQGVGNAVGMALGLRCLASKFNRDGFNLFNSKVFCLLGDGCMMEGVNHEVCSLAGHYKLNNLILIYDSNNVILDGPKSEVCSEDTKARFISYNWDVFEVDGYDTKALQEILDQQRHYQERPVLIIAKTIIGHGSPREGSHKAHGSPLGKEGVDETKDYWELSEKPFFVPSSVLNFFKKKLIDDKKLEEDWLNQLRIWSKKYPELHKELIRMTDNLLPENLLRSLESLDLNKTVSGRAASKVVINFLSDKIVNLYGGSADLSISDCSFMQDHGIISSVNFLGRNIKYGVREFGMATIMNGLAYLRCFRVFGGTFLVFSDYMRNAIRLAALSSLPIIYQFTHDSLFVGEDGPTHQPVEHIMSLRAIPGLQVIRPADGNEVKMAWFVALTYSGPTALILSRQNLEIVSGSGVSYQKGLGRGAYIILLESKPLDYTIFATGSEVKLALDVAEELIKLDKSVRVVSVPCWELFFKQSKEYQDSLIKGDLGLRISIEAGVALGWHRFIGTEGLAISMDSFGMSGAPAEVAEEFGFTVHSILERILSF